jgi:large subunit ribosomal protein L23
MALFKNTKEDTEKQSEATSTDLSWVIKKPQVTEKAAVISSDNAYTFIVSPKANKIQIKQAIRETYNVTPVKVNVINRKAHTTVRRGRTMHVTGQKKAIVFLKKGDTIELV